MGDAGGRLTGMHVLIVEDEWLVADEALRALERDGAVVIGPVNAMKDALSILDAGQRVDAALLDINLKGEMAYEIADRLIVRKVPLAFVTGYAREIAPAAYRHVPHYEKPFEACEVVQRLLARSADGEDNFIAG